MLAHRIRYHCNYAMGKYKYKYSQVVVNVAEDPLRHLQDVTDGHNMSDLEVSLYHKNQHRHSSVREKCTEDKLYFLVAPPRPFFDMSLV